MSNDTTKSIDSGLRTAIDKSVSNPVMFFFTSGAAWLAVAIGLGVFASIKFHSPAFFEGFGALNTGRAFAAHINVLIYGWCFQAAFGTIIWLMSRLCRKELKNKLAILVGGHMWNVGVALGLIAILLGKGTGVPWMEFAAVAAWFRSALVLLFFIPIAISAAYYLAPKVSGRPVYSYNLALLGFWALVVIGPWAGMQKLTGAPIPVFLTYVGAGATVLFFIPAITVGLNILMTIKGTAKLASASPSLRFTAAGTIALVGMGVLGIWLNLPSVLQSVQFSLTGYGYEMLALYGVFSMLMFGAIYFIVPRITMREWLAPAFIRLHFNLSAYSVIAIVVGSILGGYLQGLAQDDHLQAWIIAGKASRPWEWFNTISWIMILISNIFFCLHLLLMWARLGRHSKHPTLLIEKHGSAPHGADGKVQTT